MQKIYESPLHGWSESAERIHVYAIDSEEEYYKLKEMSNYDLQEHFGMYNPGYEVRPGAMYFFYGFEITNNHVIVTEFVGYNV